MASAAERLAVLELTGDLSAKERGLLSDTVRGGIVEAAGETVQVMTRENMEVMLTDMGIDASCVAEGACEVETARNLGVDFVVSGSITSMGGMLIVSMKLHETTGGSLVGSQQVRGADGLALLDGVGPAAATLSGKLASNPAPAPQPVQPAVASARPPVGAIRTDAFYNCLGGEESPHTTFRFHADGTVRQKTHNSNLVASLKKWHNSKASASHADLPSYSGTSTEVTWYRPDQGKFRYSQFEWHARLVGEFLNVVVRYRDTTNVTMDHGDCVAVPLP